MISLEENLDNGVVKNLQEQLVEGATTLSEEERSKIIKKLLIAKKQDSIILTNYEATYKEKKELEKQTKWQMIKDDFPTLSEKQIEENIELINEYYLRNLDYTILDEIVINGQEIANKVAQKRAKTQQKFGDSETCGGIAAFIHSEISSFIPLPLIRRFS